MSDRIITIYSITFNNNLLSAILCITILLLSKLCLSHFLGLEIVFKSQTYSIFIHLYYSPIVEIKLFDGIKNQ